MHKSYTRSRLSARSLFSFLFLAHRYDFDRDGYVIQDDVRLILSHVPIDNTVSGHVAKEGIFTSEGGGR